jgi:hypothetical protein
MTPVEIVNQTAEFVIGMFKKDYGLKATKLDEGGNVYVMVTSPKGNLHVGSVRLEYYALGGVFPSCFFKVDKEEIQTKVNAIIKMIQGKREKTGLTVR